MLNRHSQRCAKSHTRMRGFSLIEMMIAIVIGMIVVAGAISVTVAINQSNDETIQSTRLTQELQALASVIGDEVKRSRRMHDAYSPVGTGATPGGGPVDPIYTSDTSTSVASAACILYSYQDPTLNDPTSDAAAAVNNYRAISLSGNNVSIASGTTAVTCTTAGVQLNSPQVRITNLTFTCPLGASATPISATTFCSTSEIYMTLTGQLVNGDSYTKNLVRTVIQPIFVRSGAT